jgi:hypothetical protein
LHITDAGRSCDASRDVHVAIRNANPSGRNSSIDPIVHYCSNASDHVNQPRDGAVCDGAFDDYVDDSNRDRIDVERNPVGTPVCN